MTKGSPLRLIVLFTLPVLIGNLFQNFYNLVDSVIVGRFLGVNALAAVGATGTIAFLIFGWINGITGGFGIMLAQSFGAGEKRELHRFLWNGFWVGSFFSVLLTVGTVILAAPLMAAMNTPENIFSMGVSYIRILFLGIPASILYNYSASVLRALGDSRHPFYFLLFSSILNVVLDYVFITDFHTGVEGAAAATVISQLVSGLLNTWWMFRRMELIEIRREDMSLSFRHIRKLCIIGLPMGVEYSVSAVGAILLQDAINILGSGAVAAQTAGEKIRQMFTLPMESIGMAMATYAGQNFGAGRMDRIKRGIRDGIVIQALYCAVVWVILLLMKGILVQLVLGSGSIQVARNAEKYLMICSCLFLLHGLLMIFRNVLQGMGYAGHAVLSGIWELAGRGLGGWIAVSGAGFTAVCFANPMAWGFALCYCAVMVLWFLKRK